VDTITFGHVREGVEDGGEGVSGFPGFGVRHNFDEHAFVGLELGESVFEADEAEEFVLSSRGMFHAIEMLMELIDVLTSILVAFGRLTVDWRMIEINDALDKGYLNVVLIDLEHRQSR
jgi:hypothetical protein